VLSNLQSDIGDLIRRHFIPVPLNKFEITNSISSGDDNISINYDWMIGDSSNKQIILDMTVSPAGRVFLMLLPYNRIDDAIGDGEITIWEIVNGSTLKQLVTPNMSWSGSASGELGNQFSIGFIHNLNDSTGYTYNNSPITFGITQIINSSTIDGWRYRLYTDNSGTPLAGMGGGDDTEDDIKLYYKSEWETTSMSSVLLRNKCRYISSVGTSEIPDTYSANMDNMLWFSYHTPISNGNEGSYTVSDFTTEGTSAVATIGYASSLNASIYRFPRYYTFIFKDAYPSDVLKDICVSQDAMWYLDYSGSQINLTIKNRDSDVATTTLNDNIALREDSFVRRIKFRDLDGMLFREDATRLNYYLAYYNSTYGGGKFEKEFEVWGYRDYSLGGRITIENTDYFVKRFELETNERKTFLTLFQKGG